MFPKTIYVKQHNVTTNPYEDDWSWKSLCLVYDNEALGIIERRFAGIEIKVVSFEPEWVKSGVME